MFKNREGRPMILFPIKLDFRILKRKKPIPYPKALCEHTDTTKGSFYRSTLHVKAPDPSALPCQRLEPALVPKNESQIQISRLAATSFKVSGISKKRIKQSNRMKCSSSAGKPGYDFYEENLSRKPRRGQKNSDLIPNEKPLRPKGKIIVSKANKSSFIPKYRNRLSSIVTQKLIRANLPQEVGRDSSPNSFCRGQSKGANGVIMNGNTTPRRWDRKSSLDGVQVRRKMVKGTETDGISESSLSESPAKPMRRSAGDVIPRRPINYNLLGFSSDNEADQSSDASESDCFKRNLSERKDYRKLLNLNPLTSRQSIQEKIAEIEKSNENLNKYLSNYSLECIPNEIAFSTENFNSVDTVEELVEVINAFENFNIALPKKTFVYQASVLKSDLHKEEKQLFNKSKSNLENIVTAKLMGDIDLHLELENYLKAISTSEETGGYKVRTKNTLQQNYVNCARGENTDFKGSNIIENQLGRSVSGCRMISSENSKNANEKEKFGREESNSERLLNEARRKSSTSFKSAISAGTPLSSPIDKNLENQFFVFLDRKAENFPVSLEYIDSKPTKYYASHTSPQFLEESKSVKQIRSENDAIALHQDSTTKGLIKRTIGEISLQPPQWDATLPLPHGIKFRNSLPISLIKDTQGKFQSNLYETISPLESYCDAKLKPNTKSSVLFTNSFYSTSADSLKHKANIGCDSVQLCTNIPPMIVPSKYKLDNNVEETIAEQKQSECVLSGRTTMDDEPPDESVKSPVSSVTLNSNSENWSPTLQELIEIYNSVLKQNKKIRRCNINRVKRCISSYLMSFIQEIIEEKKHKKELINYAKERIGDSKLKVESISNIYAEKSKNSDKKFFTQLVEYVNRFQEVLSSSLSIKQIAQLNNMMASLQDLSLEPYTPPTRTGNKKKIKKIKNVMSEKKNSKSPIMSSRSKQKNFKCDGRVKGIKDPKRGLLKDVQESISFRTNKRQKRKTVKTTNNEKLKLVKEVKLPPFSELESVLQSYIADSEKAAGKDSEEGKSVIKPNVRRKNKFLVNVKLDENKIIVNGMKRFKSEKALTKAHLLSKEETSDLIIESVSSKQIEKLQSSSKMMLSESSCSNKKISNEKKIKKPEVKTSKQGTHRFRTGGKPVKRKVKEIVSEEEGTKAKESVSHVRIRRLPSTENVFQDEELFINKFEYNHHQLKIQHPIEAIIESSESRISEKIVDNYNEHLLNQEESRFHVEGEIVKDETGVLSEKDLNVLKSLTKSSVISNVGSGEEPSVPFQCARSCLAESPKRKSETSPNLENKISPKKIMKFTKPAVATNIPALQSSKVLATKKKLQKKILLTRPRSTYLTYPYLQCIQGDKITKSNKCGKSKKIEEKPGSSSRERTVLKTDSSRKGQNKTKALKNISKGRLLNLFKRSSEKREQQSKMSKSNSNPTEKTILRGKQGNSKKSENVIDYQISNSKIEDDDPNWELISSSINGLNVGSGLVVGTPSFVSLTSSERILQEPKQSTSLCNYEVNENGECNGADVKASVTSQSSTATVDGYKRPAIVIHARNEGSDNVSFPSLMVLSESFLKCYSSFALSRTKIKSLFKSHSDMKFYPGRVADSPEEQTPFVTFVLTPKQKDEAGVPDYQTKIVTKPKVSEEVLKKENKEKDFHVNFEQISHENSLRAIELFIESLSESRKKVCKLKKQDVKPKKASQNEPKKLYVSASKPCPTKCTFTPCRRLQALVASKRKAYHECQKRSLSVKTDHSKKGTYKTNPVSENRNQNQGSGWDNARKNKSHENAKMMKAEVREPKVVEENLALTTKTSCVLDKVPKSVSYDERNEMNVLPESEEECKTAENIVENFDESHKKMGLNTDLDAIESDQHSCDGENDSERKMQMTKNTKKIRPFGNIRNCKSVDSSDKQVKEIVSNQKLKTVKIHCTQSYPSIQETTEVNFYPSFVEGIESEGNLTRKISAEISDGEKELLDSLSLREKEYSWISWEEDSLERKSSTYFDFEENEENSENLDDQLPQENSITKWECRRMNSSTKLPDTMPLQEIKVKNPLIDKTERRWRKILSLLDDVTKEMEKSSEEESDNERDYEETTNTEETIPNSKDLEPEVFKVLKSLKKQTLERTKSFWYKVKTIMSVISEISEGRESTQGASFLSQNSFSMIESFRIQSQMIISGLRALTNFSEIFSIVLHYVNAFKAKFNMKPEAEMKLDGLGSDTKSPPNWHELPVVIYHSKSQSLSEANSSGFLIHKTNNMFNIPEALGEFPLKDDESNHTDTWKS